MSEYTVRVINTRLHQNKYSEMMDSPPSNKNIRPHKPIKLAQLSNKKVKSAIVQIYIFM